MEISCQKCKSKFRIADDKIQPDRTTTLRCPRCKAGIVIGAKPLSGALPSSEPEPAGNEAAPAACEGYADTPFDFTEEEGKTALICEESPEVIKKVSEVLKIMEYHITEAESTRDALKRMRYHDYDLVVVNESFDTANPDDNGVLIYLERLGMAVRRKVFVAMISRRYRTMDQFMAFSKSVNMIINSRNLNQIGGILGRGLTERDLFYRVFNESLEAVGRN
jgi:predicted Zn finger-like uncharacterized protein